MSNGSNVDKKEELKQRWKVMKYDIDKFVKTLDKPDSLYSHKVYHDYVIRFGKFMKRLKKVNKGTKEFLKEIEMKNKK
jgi:hypothetical protein